VAVLDRRLMRWVMVRAVVVVMVVRRLVTGRVCRVKVWHEAVVGD
jgi:hypothetical protein